MHPQCKVVFYLQSMKKAILTSILVIFAMALFAQGSDDACRFAQTYYQGTAKALGMGNAMGAVGGDMTAICINPAGMGLYRSGELTMTLNLSDNHNTSSYYGDNASGNRFRISIPNLGFVSAKQRSNYKPLRYTQFCIGLTRTNDYNIHAFASGLNPSSSMIDSYLNQIDGYAVNELSEYFPYTVYPAWSTYLVDVDGQGYYTSPVPQGGITQSLDQAFKGRSEEWTFGYSANYFDRLFLGVSMGINHIKRIGSTTFVETLPTDSYNNTDFRNWTFEQDFSSRGLGVNGKVGMIWMATPWLRLGATYHTRTIYTFEESWQTQTESQLQENSLITRKYLSPKSSYEYYFFSPRKWVGSMAFVVSDQWMISMDAEMVNFGSAKFTSSSDDYYDYSSVNQDIKESYCRTFNFRLGTEWRINDSYLRLGAGYYGSPFGLGERNGSIKKASVGISLPIGQYSTFDVAYELTHGYRQYFLYDAGELDIEPVTQHQLRHVAIATLKVKL